MDRRSFIVLLAAGCADPSANMLPVAADPVPATTSGDASFDAWAREFYGRARAAGLPGDLLDREMAGLTPNPRIMTLDSAQPEFSKPVGDYIKGTVSDERIARGQRFRSELPFWPEIEARYGVPRDILMELGRRGMVGGQEDMIEDTAITMARERSQAAQRAAA